MFAWNSANAAESCSGLRSPSRTATCMKLTPSASRNAAYEIWPGALAFSSAHTGRIRRSFSSAHSGLVVYRTILVTLMLSPLDGAHLVVSGVVGELGQAERLKQRRQVHAEPAAVAVAQPVPAPDRIARGPSERLDGAAGGGLLLVRGSQRHPAVLGLQPGVQVLDGPQPVAQLGRADLADQLGRVGLLVLVHRVAGRARRRGQLPRVVPGASAHWRSPSPECCPVLAVEPIAAAKGGSSGCQPLWFPLRPAPARSPSRSPPPCPVSTPGAARPPARHPSSTA